MRIKSLKLFLLLTISITLLLTTGATIIWSYNTINNNIASLFDILLVDSANNIRIFLKSNLNNDARLAEIQSQLIIHDPTIVKSDNSNLKKKDVKLSKYILWAENYTENYESDAIFQVWTMDPKNLILHSGYAPTEQFAEFTSGFTDIVRFGNKYRIYTQLNPDLNLIIQTAQNYEMRHELATIILKQRLYPLIIFTPILFLLIFFAIKLAADSIRYVTDAIKRRDPKNLNLLDTKNPPKEILPLVEEINRLFVLINNSFAREQRFNSDAAHELKTPLAGIKIQAEVVKKILSDIELETDTKKTLKQNLTNIISGIDRSDHIISQLLILSRLSPDHPLKDIEPCQLDKIAREVIVDLINHAENKKIIISLNLFNSKGVKIKQLSQSANIQGNKILLNILLRNLIDNAIKYSGKHSKIYINLKNQDNLVLEVIDNGPGLPEHLKKRVFDRFYRVPGTKASGSGLGLSIVKLIAQLHHAQISVSDNTKDAHGLIVTVAFNKFDRTT